MGTIDNPLEKVKRRDGRIRRRVKRWEGRVWRRKEVEEELGKGRRRWRRKEVEEEGGKRWRRKVV